MKMGIKQDQQTINENFTYGLRSFLKQFSKQIIKKSNNHNALKIFFQILNSRI